MVTKCTIHDHYIVKANHLSCLQGKLQGRLFWHYHRNKAHENCSSTYLCHTCISICQNFPFIMLHYYYYSLLQIHTVELMYIQYLFTITLETCKNPKACVASSQKRNTDNSIEYNSRPDSESLLMLITSHAFY